MTQITAKIEKAQAGVWLIIEHLESSIENTRWPYREDELPAIRDAIDSYLKQKEA